VNEKPRTQPVADPGPQPRKRSALVYVLGFIALAVLPVLALNSLATADTAATAGYGSAAGARHHSHPHLTPALQQCLAEHGVTLPTPSPSAPRAPLTPAQRDAFRTAAVACGITGAPSGGQPGPKGSS
jgi:hypothetical protein